MLLCLISIIRVITIRTYSDCREWRSYSVTPACVLCLRPAHPCCQWGPWQQPDQCSRTKEIRNLFRKTDPKSSSWPGRPIRVRRGPMLGRAGCGSLVSAGTVRVAFGRRRVREVRLRRPSLRRQLHCRSLRICRPTWRCRYWKTTRRGDPACVRAPWWMPGRPRPLGGDRE